ncbi:MAG: PQQ-binding-like beta-propeller repeat protein [bacterium]|nr:PQQ-binding-like beta-propeller repeat protein [bacterium]
MTQLLILLPVLAAPIGQHLPDTGDFLRDADLQRVSLQRYWSADLPLPAGDRAVGAHLVDDRLYVTTRLGNAVALHAPSGVVMWSRNLNEGLIPIQAPGHLQAPDGPGPVIFLADNEAFVFDRDSGDPLTQFELPFVAGSSAVGDLDTFYAGSTDGHMYAIRWGRARHGGNAVQAWRVRTGGPIRSAPRWDGQELYFASADGGVYGCRAYNRMHQWTVRTGGPIAGDPVLDLDAIFVASGDRSLYRMERLSGATAWRRRLPTALRDGPTVAGRTVYQYADDSGLHAVDMDTGHIVWVQPQARAFLAHRSETAYLLSENGRELLIVDDATGEVRQRLDVFGTRLTVPNAQDDAIYLVTAVNRVVCLRSADAPYLTAGELTAIRARLLQGGATSGSQ